MDDYRINGLSLHSKYDPPREAKRYLSSLSLSPQTGIFILLEPGAGYLSRELLLRFPHALVLEIHCDSRFHCTDISQTLFSWSPGSGESLRSFLSSHISEYDLGIIQIIEWQPANKIFGKEYVGIQHMVQSFLQEKRSVVHTTGKFGHRWIKNIFRNILNLPPLISFPSPSNMPILIAASGPSLERAIPLIKTNRNRLSLWSLPSSLSLFNNHGIQPDFVFHTDPGFYATYHLRFTQDEPPPLLSPLNAAHPPRARKQILLNTHSPVETFLIDLLSLPCIPSTSHGTVAGSAFYTALSLNPPLILFAGLDLAFQDILAHCRPHTFDHLLVSKIDRYSSITELYYRRSPRISPFSNSSGNKQQNFSLSRYAEWFRSISEPADIPVYRLFPSSVPIPSFQNIVDSVDFDSLLTSYKRNDNSEFSSAPVRVPEQKLPAALHTYIQKVLYQEDLLFREAADISDLPLLEEFIRFSCYSELFRLNSCSWKHGRRLKNADKSSLRDCIFLAAAELESAFGGYRKYD